VAGMTQRDAVDLVRTSGNLVKITALRQVYTCVFELVNNVYSDW
jgi:hypothetical protein